MPGRILLTFLTLIFIVISIFVAPSLRAELLSQPDGKILKTAIATARYGDWTMTALLGSRLSSPLSKKIVAWLIYKAPNSGASFTDITKFIDKHPDWPAQNLLRQRAEEALTEANHDHVILNWCKHYPAVSTSGSIAQISALVRINHRNEAKAVAQHAWVNSDMGMQQEHSFCRQFRKMLRPEDETARIDQFLWDEGYI